MNKVKLKEICRLINGRAYKQHELLESGKYPVLRVGNFFSDKEFYYSDMELDKDKYCDNGDLLFAWSASFGPKIWNGGKVIYHYHIWKMELTENVDKNYLYYYLYYLSERIKREGHGGIMIHTTKAEMEEREFVLPELLEQREIAKILANISSVIEMRKQELEKLDELIKARFVERFGDPISNPKDWKKVVITDLCKKICGGGTPSKSQKEYFEGEIPWVSPKDMKSMIIRDSQDHITEEAIENSSTNLIPENSVLMVIRSGILKHSLPVAINAVPVTINQDMKAFVPGDKITTEYLMYYFKAIEVEVLSGVRGVTADNIDFKDFQKREVITPPIEMQKQFVDFVNQINKSKSIKLGNRFTRSVIA